MPYAYYSRLQPRQQAIYRRSDTVAELKLAADTDLAALVAALEHALAAEQRTGTERAAQALVTALLAGFKVRPVRVKVLTKRPSTRSSELHGLYELGDRRTLPVVTVWMRTAQLRRVVAFRTFLRTLLHEVCHHLDYALLDLEDSFHTEGFFKRESSLFKQLVAE